MLLHSNHACVIAECRFVPRFFVTPPPNRLQFVTSFLSASRSIQDWHFQSAPCDLLLRASARFWRLFEFLPRLWNGICVWFCCGSCPSQLRPCFFSEIGPHMSQAGVLRYTPILPPTRASTEPSSSLPPWFLVLFPPFHPSCAAPSSLWFHGGTITVNQPFGSFTRPSPPPHLFLLSPAFPSSLPLLPFPSVKTGPP